MRPFEIVCVLVACLLWALVLKPNMGTTRLRLGAGALAVAAAALQFMLEGWRWQRLLLDLMTLVLLLLILGQAWTDPSRGSRRWPRLAKWFAAFALTAALGVSIQVPYWFPVPNLPRPDGAYAIGTVTYHWVDSRREEPFTPTPNDRRELMVQVWYPADGNPAEPLAPYVDKIELEPTLKLLHLPGFLLGHLKYIKSHAHIRAPLSQKDHAWPVIIFSPGRGGYRQNDTFLTEYLVSHGYVVVGIDHPYTVGDVVFPDGRHVTMAPIAAGDSYDKTAPASQFYDRTIYPLLGQDAVFTLDKLGDINAKDPQGILTGRLSLDRVGILGSSLGGATVAEACHLDPRFVAGVALEMSMPSDVVASRFSTPFLWFSRSAESRRREGWTPAAIKDTEDSDRSVFGQLGESGYIVSIDGMYHADISDFPLLFRAPVGQLLGISGPADWRETHAAIQAYTLAFFDRYLKRAPSPLLDGPASPFSGIRVERGR